MKKVLLTLLILFLAPAPRIFSLDLMLSGGLGNLAFDNKRTEALSALSPAGHFKPSYFPLILTQLSGDYKDLYYSIGFERDPILRNRLFANLKLDLEYFFLEAGPILGLFNSSKQPLSPGASVGLGFTFPGIIFAEASGSTTIGILMESSGSYFQRSGDIIAGFWVPYVVCSFTMSIRNFTSREAANLVIEDSLKRYYFRADVYTKNLPYTIRLDLGFQDLSRSYTSRELTSGGDLVHNTDTDEFKSVFLGLEGSYTINPVVKVFLGGEIPVYSWGVRPMKDPPKSAFLFKIWTGFIWTLPAGKN